MAVYARPSWKLARQIFGDLFVVAWTYGWYRVGLVARDSVQALAEPARKIATAAQSMHDGFDRAGESVAGLPLVGDELRKPFDDAAISLAGIVTSATDQATEIERVATITGWLAFLIPVLVLVVIWLPRRLRFVTTSSAAQRFIDNQADLDLFALRALASQPMHVLARISDDPVRAWRQGDREVIEALAEIELRKAGLRGPNPTPEVETDPA